MKTNTVMKMNCVECGKRYRIANDEIDNYNIYWIANMKTGFMPKLLCPPCTDKFAKNLKSS